MTTTQHTITIKWNTIEYPSDVKASVVTTGFIVANAVIFGIICLVFGMRYAGNICQMEINEIKFEMATALIVYGWVAIGAAIFSIVCTLMLWSCNIGLFLQQFVVMLCVGFEFSWFVVMSILLFNTLNDCGPLYILALAMFITRLFGLYIVCLCIGTQKK